MKLHELEIGKAYAFKPGGYYFRDTYVYNGYSVKEGYMFISKYGWESVFSKEVLDGIDFILVGEETVHPTMRNFLGKRIKSIKGMEEGSDSIVFHLEDGYSIEMYHDQDCCGNVRLEEIWGDPQDLIGQPILMAESVAQDMTGYNARGHGLSFPESSTWTFIKFATVNGYVTLRWVGESNGYYSESVDLQWCPKEDSDAD